MAVVIVVVGWRVNTSFVHICLAHICKYSEFRLRSSPSRDACIQNEDRSLSVLTAEMMTVIFTAVFDCLTDTQENNTLWTE